MMSSLTLVVFDFDDTIVDCNSDIYINKMIEEDGKMGRPDDRPIPSPSSPSWPSSDQSSFTQYMRSMFKYLHALGIKEADYKKCLESMPLIKGIKDLILNLKNKTVAASPLKKEIPKYELLVISDANSFFIDTFMKFNGFDKAFSQIFTNPGKFNEQGCLEIQEYHEQDWCNISTRNLCKGFILKNYIRQQYESDNIVYDRIAYIGDGQNDYCPSLTLQRSTDLIFPRKNFPLHKLIKQSNGQNLKAQVHIWENGYDILKALESTEMNSSRSLLGQRTIIPPTPPPSPASSAKVGK